MEGEITNPINHYQDSEASSSNGYYKVCKGQRHWNVRTRGGMFMYVCVCVYVGGWSWLDRLTFLLLISLEGWAQWLERGGHSCCEAESAQHSKPLSPQTYVSGWKNIIYYYIHSIIKSSQVFSTWQIDPSVLTFSASPAPAVRSALVAPECFVRLPHVSIDLQNTPWWCKLTHISW